MLRLGIIKNGSWTSLECVGFSQRGILGEVRANRQLLSVRGRDQPCVFTDRILRRIHRERDRENADTGCKQENYLLPRTSNDTFQPNATDDANGPLSTHVAKLLQLKFRL